MKLRKLLGKIRSSVWLFCCTACQVSMRWGHSALAWTALTPYIFNGRVGQWAQSIVYFRWTVYSHGRVLYVGKLRYQAWHLMTSFLSTQCSSKLLQVSHVYTEYLVVMPSRTTLLAGMLHEDGKLVKATQKKSSEVKLDLTCTIDITN